MNLNTNPEGMDVYFARRSGLYGSTIDERSIDLILEYYGMKIANGINILDPAVLIKDRQKEIDEIKSNSKKETFIMEQICFPAIDNCSIFVYLLDNNDIALSPGVESELDYAIRSKYKNKDNTKRIFRIFQKGNELKLVEMTTGNIEQEIKKWCRNDKEDTIISIGDKIRSEWALKNVNDYLKFYETNPEAAELIIKQFREGRWIEIRKDEEDKDRSEKNYIRGDVACIPHYNSAYETSDYKKVIWCNCPLHQGGLSRHAFYELRDKEFRRTCMFTGVRSVAPGYSKMKLDRFDEHNLEDLFLSSRTIHRSMNLFDNSTFNKGIVLRDVIGNVVLSKGGKSVADLRKVVGCIPVIDLDLDGSFFDKDIFDGCQEALKVVRGYMGREWPGVGWRLGFSGNGLYIIFDRLIFKRGDEENDGITYGQWLIHWKQKREKLEKLLKGYGIRKVKVEKKYGWNRYFKVMGTFHLNVDRIAIPLDKYKELDYEWMNEMTNIKNGLEKNIFKEIMDKAGPSWRL